MNQGGALQRVVRAFGAQLSVGEPAQLRVDQRHQLAKGTLVAGRPVEEELSYPVIGGFVHIVAQPADRATRKPDCSREYATEGRGVGRVNPPMGAYAAALGLNCCVAPFRARRCAVTLLQTTLRVKDPVQLNWFLSDI